MEFIQFSHLFRSYVDKMVKDHTHLFTVEVDKDEMWNLYLDSFPEGTNEVYRTRREFDCSCCRHFIKSFGNIVSIVDNEIESVWDFDPEDSTFTPVVNALSNYIHSKSINGVLVTKLDKFGVEKSLEALDTGRVKSWDHFAIKLPKKFVTTSSETIDTISSQFATSKQVFQRSLEEISLESINTVLDLIDENQLYRGAEWKSVLIEFRKLKVDYTKSPDKNNFCWANSVKVSGSVSRIKNHSMGTLLMDLSEGTEINEAIRKYEAIVAPTNYKRPKEVFTAKMVEQAQKTVVEMGYKLSRRFANLSDITINNVIWANRNAKKAMEGNVFELLKNEANTPAPKNAQPIGIEKFISDILPNVSSVEAFVENNHKGNLVSLITSKEDSPTMFKWNNNFSWIYNGNIADSMKQLVKNAGGKVDGVLRFSIRWDDNPNDFDAHCIEPNGFHIYYPVKRIVHRSSGILDVDIINPIRGTPAVENITWSDINLMQEGEYQFYVNCYYNKGGRTGFSAEIEYGGQIWEYEYNMELRTGENVPVAKIQFSKRDGIKFIQSLPSTTTSSEVWNIKTQQFIPVSVICYSPNYWDEQGVGNKHYMFMLSNCQNPDCPNGFLNEYLKEDLMKHKHVFSALGSKMKVDQDDNQLSGLGFSSTQRNALIVKADQKLFKVIF